jgi:hypothetical protein
MLINEKGEGVTYLPLLEPVHDVCLRRESVSMCAVKGCLSGLVLGIVDRSLVHGWW